MKQDFKKLSISLRYWLLGKGYIRAVKAMDYAAKYHTGMRKDGVTPEFQHQVSQAQLFRSVHHTALHPEDTFICIFMHDVVEDYDVSRVEICQRFGELAADATWKMTKVYRDTKKTVLVYFTELGECPIASVNKALDRIHNHLSMDGVFSIEKQKEYIRETEDEILPMIKIARRNFPEQDGIYENLKFILMQQISLYKSLHKAIEQHLIIG